MAELAAGTVGAAARPAAASGAVAGDWAVDPHPLRGAVLGELHARPFLPLSAPTRQLHLGFMTTPEAAAADRLRLKRFCEERAQPGPEPEARHHRVALADADLRWEQHSEFTTYTWQVGGRDQSPFQPAASSYLPIVRCIAQPGPLLIAVDLHIIPDAGMLDIETMFDPASLAAALVDAGGALAATDFRPSSDGFIRILVLDRGLTPARAGALVQRLLEVETYRTLALLGLPEAQRLQPAVRDIEDALTRIAREMRGVRDLESDNRLLDELTDLAAALEADANASASRLSATRAYDNIVSQRLIAVGEVPVQGYPTFAAFLSRRMGPALRTCQLLEQRLDNLSRKLAGAAQLLRTRVDVAIEQQNRDLLRSMNERTRLQLRLQQTVEGLSIAAISYYVVGLAGYMLKGAKDAGLAIDPGIATALTVPLALVLVGLAVRRIRKRHGTEHE